MLARYLHFKENIWDAVHAPRIHHQLAPMRLQYEEGISNEIVNGLDRIGHKMYKSPSDSGFASLTAIGRNGNQLSAVYDPRRKGSAHVS